MTHLWETVNDEIWKRKVVVTFLDGTRYDFRSKDERNAAVRRALETGAVFGSFERYTKVVTNMFIMEMLGRERQLLISTIGFLGRNPSKKSAFHLSYLIQDLSVPTVIKFLFKNESFWKPLLSAIFATISFGIADSLSAAISNYARDCLQRGDVFRWLDAKSMLSISLHYWGETQFRWAIDHGLCEIIILLCKEASQYAVHQNYENIKMEFGSGLYLDSKAQMKKLDRKYNCNLVPYFQRSWNKMQLRHNYICIPKVSQYAAKARTLQKLIRIGMSLSCAWPPCSKSANDTKYVCKGCHLTKYCCRNHQKKHWKYVHRQQCFCNVL